MVDNNLLATFIGGGGAVATIGAVVWLVRLEGRVNLAHAQIERIQEEVEALSDVRERLSSMEATMKHILEQFRDLNSSIRWMRQPAAYDPQRPHD